MLNVVAALVLIGIGTYVLTFSVRSPLFGALMICAGCPFALKAVMHFLKR
ncbi:MAG: hypothetical protein JNJ55_06445 [Betaproteobacteria bacterium]|nr:hypothetical protein [Betaproteobacteria bacterium]